MHPSSPNQGRKAQFLKNNNDKPFFQQMEILNSSGKKITRCLFWCDFDVMGYYS